MNPFGKAKISTAADRNREFKFNSRHVTTSDFFQFCPIYHRELVPHTHIKLDVRAFSRMADLPVPTFGDAKLNLRAFFVPMRTLWRGWDNFITQSYHVGSSVSELPVKVPVVTNSTLASLYIDVDFSTQVEMTTIVGDQIVPSNADFVFINNAGTVSARKFTQFGRLVYKLVTSLGYQNSFDIRDTSQYSALPLLSLFRIYLDWYYPSQYYGDASSVLLESLLVKDSTAELVLSPDTLRSLFKIIAFVNYGEDYFTSAFDSPNAPVNLNQGLIPFTTILDINKKPDASYLDVGQVTTAGPSSPYYLSTPSMYSENGSFSQYIVDALKSLSDFMKRHQLVGARAFERFAARWNVKLPESKLNRSYYCGHHSLDMIISDVMCTADSEGSSLGDYAGKGIIAGSDGFFEYETDEFGYFVVCSTIIPEIGYFQGNQKKTRHLSMLDFFTPEFDMMGNQAISVDEVFKPIKFDRASFAKAFYGDEAAIRPVDNVFGFTPRYAEYKIPYCNLTGDFRCPSLLEGDASSSWHLFRIFQASARTVGSTEVATSQADVIHSRNFLDPKQTVVDSQSASQGASVSTVTQYDRIFNEREQDHFQLIYYFQEHLFMPMKPLYETYEFKDEFEHDARIVDTNGVRFN